VTAAETFADWALKLRLEDVPSEVRHAAKRHLLDGVGCAIAAARTDAAPYATALLDDAGEATVIGTEVRASTNLAALANGILTHALDFDDTHALALVHSTAAVMPAAFAVGESTQANGAQALAAAIAGYEVVNRLGAAVTHGFHARGFHATSVCGVFASALIASRLMGLDPNQTVSALGIAGSTAAGSLEFLNTGSATKQLHPGLAAMNGILAARLAHAGAEGPNTIFEGEHGLYRSYLNTQVDPQALTDGLGDRWETTRITIKPYPACQLSHASLDALRAAGVTKTLDIDRITFEIPHGVSSIVSGKPEPRTPYEGKFSLEYCAAAMLIDGDLTIGSFEPESLIRDDVKRVAARVAWSDRSFDGAPAEAPGICEVRLRDGTLLRGEVAKSRGGPDAPLSDEELLAKFHANGGTEKQADAMLSLDAQPSITKALRA
jgi:2-methylcitrate dehydratase PrpD